jgi:alpha-L-rhamnosidase
MYRNMAGIKLDESVPGYKHILIEPHPGGGFAHVRASHETMYGKVASVWELKGNRFALTVEVPVNTNATVRLPKAKLSEISEGQQIVSRGNGILNIRQDGDSTVVEIGSGQYRFTYDLSK